jgi:hypothetical protein
MPAKLFLLPAPWATFDPQIERFGIGRRALSEAETTEVPAGFPLFLAAPSGIAISLSGFRMAAHPLTRSFEFGKDEYRVHCLSIGTREADTEFTVFADHTPAGTIRIKSPVIREKNTQEQTASHNHAFQVDSFNLGMLDTIRLGTDERFNAFQVYWDRLSKAWATSNDAHSDPPMALIVRHANELKKRIDSIAERPRSILRRTRRLTPLNRVDHVDTASLRWLSRQPGITVAERAGSKQQIMAVQREESFDTLENRVLRDYSARAAMIASAYCERYSKLENSIRWKAVKGFSRSSHRHDRDMREREISRASYPLTPNYVLLHDQRYRLIWRAYLEIIRQEDEEDEAWRWQYRLWCDFVRLTIHISLRSSLGRHSLVAESPVRIRDEQMRGSWVSIDSLSGVWLADIKHVGEVVISMIWSPEADNGAPGWAQVLGCTALLLVEPLGSSRCWYIAVWAMHDFGYSPQPIQDQLESSERAILQLTNNLHLVDDKKVDLAGLVIASDLTGKARETEKPVCQSEKGVVLGYRLGTNLDSLSDQGPRYIRQILETLVSRHSGNSPA